MSVLYVFMGLIVVAAATCWCIGVGHLTKYLIRKYDSEYDYDSTHEVPSFLLGVFVFIALAIVIGLVVALSYFIGESVINALNK